MKSVLIVGKPNSGKSLLFNRLTGLRQKVANFSGVTVDIKTGRADDILYTDYPGVYSLNAITEDEKCIVDAFHKALKSDTSRVVVCILDATRLERSLIFGLQVQMAARKHNKAVIFALNMMDEIEANGLSIDIKKLSKELGSSVVAISAQTKKNLDHLKETIQQALTHPERFLPKPSDMDIFKRSKHIRQLFFSKQETLLHKQNRWDRLFLSRFTGGILFIAIISAG